MPETKTTRAPKRTCQNCGRVVRVNDVFCPACGQLLDGQAQSGDTEPLEGTVEGVSTHSRIVAALLAFFLGSLGIHNFYLGYYNRALVQLLLTLILGPLTCGSVAVGIYIWAFIEGIMIIVGSDGYATDASGAPLKD